MKRNTLKNDILLIASVLLLAAALWGVSLLVQKPGGEAVVTVDGTTVAVLPLDTDTAVTLRPAEAFPADSDFCNTVVVSGGRVCVQNANCRDHICEQQGWIFRDGESIVCLPHRLVVSVRGSVAGGLDAAAR